jgi:hypothetical protein
MYMYMDMDMDIDMDMDLRCVREAQSGGGLGGARLKLLANAPPGPAASGI